MNITCLAVDKLRVDYYREAADDYAQRLQRYLDFQQREVKPVRGKRSTDEVVRIEGERLLDAVPDGAVLLALDERGKQLTSAELADLIDRYRFEARQVCFVIGGSDGLSRQLRANASTTLSLSRMTLPHELARVLLIEQLYRAMTILGGEQYHK